MTALGHLGFHLGTILAFLSIRCPNISNQLSSPLAFCSGGEGQNRFSRWSPWRLSWIPDGNDLILAIFDLQVALILSTKFRV